MSEKKEGVSRRTALKYIATGVVCGVVAGVGGFYAGRVTAPVKEVIKEVPVYKPTPPTKPKPPAVKKPIRIGFSMALSGGLAAAGKAALLAMQMWKDDVNAKGGLWGERPVELVYYDDHTNPADVPAIYEKLITVDKVDYVVGPYGTVLIAAAMPTIMEHKMAFITLFGLAVNPKFKYKYYFQIMPTGESPYSPYENWSLGFFTLADEASPRPKTVAITGVAHEYGKNAAIGARKNAERFGFDVVYEELAPPGTTDFTPVMRAIKAKNPDIVFIGTYPPGTVGMIKAAKEVGLVPKMIGGGLVGWQYASIKQTFGPTLNGVVNYDFWVPVPTMKFPGIDEFLRRYQAKAPELGIDPLGYYLPPWAYAYVQVLGQAIEATGTPEDLPTQEEVGEYMRKATFDTIVGKVKFGPLGEWEKSRVLMMQHRNVKSSDIEEFKKSDRYSVLYPPEYRWGEFEYPFKGWR